MQMVREVEAGAERDGWLDLDDVLAEMDRVIAEAEQARAFRRSPRRPPT
jgi:hypothetical protein